MRFLRFLILLLAPFVSLPAAWGQGLTLTGKVEDKVTGEGIPFAHVVIQGSATGAITDLYGNFRLSFPEADPTRNLIVSCVGYKTVGISLANLSRRPLIIQLELDIVRLHEVVVTPEDPLELLKEAIRRVPLNYDTVATVLSGYYKVSSALAEKNVHSSEAFIDIFNHPYLEEPEIKDRIVDSIAVREARVRAKEVNDWKLEVMMPWERSIYQLEFRDIVRDLGRKNLMEKFLNSYDFELENLVMINGSTSYMIRLLPRKNKKLAYWKGYIYLDRETLAIVKWETVSTPRMFSQLKGDLGYIILSKLYGVRYEEGEWKERVTYEKHGDKWYFKEVNSSKHFEISSKKRDLDMAPVNVTLQYRTDSVRRTERPDSLDYLPAGGWQVGEYLKQLYDSSFWSDFDRARGIVSDDSTYAIVASGQPEQAYTISRLDSLQGALTPLRTCFDVTYYHLDVEILPEEEVLKGSNLIRFRVIQPAERIQIDLFSEMTIDSITWRGLPLNFKREFNAVYVDFPRSLQPGSTEEIKVFYGGRPVDVDLRIPMYAAFLWAEDENGTPWFQAICQGYGASGWWPNKDHLSDEPDSMALSYTVPSDLNLIANGRLRHKTNLSGNRTRYEWFVSYPINNYNATLNAGDYKQIKDVYVNDDGDTLDLEYFVLPYHLDNAESKLSVVKPMLRTFEKYFGKYPFYRDGFKIVESPHAMEHQSCVSIDAGYFGDTDSPDFSNGNINFSIVLHESAHEWWGNNVSCTDNAELWIHESFATYAEALYIEDHYGYEASQKYLNGMKQSVANRNPIIGPLGINYIHHGDGDMYEKGALMLNTLRHVINNDSTWFAILKGIQEEFRFQTIGTDDIITYFNEKTGTDYSGIFDQYLRFRDIPELEFNFENIDGTTWLNYRWISDIDDFIMPVSYRLDKNQWRSLFPSSEWQRMSVPDNAINAFEVDVDHFYISVNGPETQAK